MMRKLTGLFHFAQSIIWTLFSLFFLAVPLKSLASTSSLLCSQIFESSPAPNLETRATRPLSQETNEQLEYLQKKMSTFISNGRILNASRVYDLAKQILKIEPRNSDARMRLVTSSMSLGRFNEAQQALQSALEENPTNPTLRILFAKALSKSSSLEDKIKASQIAQSLFEEGDFTEAEWANLGTLALWIKERPLLAQIIEKMNLHYPMTEKSLKLELELLKFQNKPETILKKTNTLTESQSRDFEITEIRAWALYDLRRSEEAAALIETKIPVEKRPSSADFLYSEALYSLRRPEEALAAIDRAISRKKTPNRHFMKVRYKILKTLQQYNTALSLLKQMELLFPNDSFLPGALVEMNYLNSSLIRKSNPEESSRLLDQSYQITTNALKLNPQDEFFLKYKARILIRMEHYEEALAISKSLIPLRQSPSDYDEMATVCSLRLGQFNQALQYSQGLYSKNPKDPVTLDHLARSLIGLGRAQEAAKYLEQGILDGISDNLIWIDLAKAYELMLEYDKAIKILSDLQKNEPESLFIKDTLERVERKKRTQTKEN